MSDNVIILGAGFSAGAGIPLLPRFVDTMWTIAESGQSNGQMLSPDDVDTFEKASGIRRMLDNYHGRANFDDRNIEDILSILAFNVLAEEAGAIDQAQHMNAAIARTIELTCMVKHPGIPIDGKYMATIERVELYVNFWKYLFQWVKNSRKQLPSIITFNYDLVLERSLLQTLIGIELEVESQGVPFENINLDYHYDKIPPIPMELFTMRFRKPDMSGAGGTALRRTSFESRVTPIQLDLLKLHGSVNFRATNERENHQFNFCQPVSNPAILPPIFNKLSERVVNSVWKSAMNKIREAKNIIIVGYSLPQTDIYMQYFLKASLGPNWRLKNIFIYDPAIFKEPSKGEAMKRRYEECFSQQIRNRVSFSPPTSFIGSRHENQRGTTLDFVTTLANDPGSLLV